MRMISSCLWTSSSSALAAFFLLTATMTATTRASNFLFVSGPFVASHASYLHAVTTQLVRMGHQATSVWVAEEGRSALKDLGPNHTERIIYFDNSDNTIPMVTQEKMGRIVHPLEAYWAVGESIRGVLSAPSPSPLLSEYCHVLLRDIRPELEKEKFDLVVVEALHNECGLALAYHLKAKVLLSLHTGSGGTNLELTTANTPLAYIPSIFTGLHERMNFWERLLNMASQIQTQIFLYHFMGVSDSVIRQYLPQVPSLSSLFSEVNGGFFNMHYVLDYPRPLPPTFVCAGGLQIEELPKPQGLPQELDDFMSENKEGVILVSFGSILRLEMFPDQVLSALIDALVTVGPNVILRMSELPLKYETSKKLLAMSSVPQQLILSDGRTRLFVTHGGSKGALESIYHGVPMVGMAIFGDQYDVVAKIVDRQVGLAIDKQDNASTMHNVFTEVLTNPKYGAETRRLGQLMKADPRSPMESVLELINFVLDTDGAEHLKLQSRRLSWTQLYLADLSLFLLVASAVAVSLICVSCRRRGTHNNTENEDNNVNGDLKKRE